MAKEHSGLFMHYREMRDNMSDFTAFERREVAGEIQRILAAIPSAAEVDAALLHLKEAQGADMYLGISQHEADQRAFISERLDLIEPLLKRLKEAVG